MSMRSISRNLFLIIILLIATLLRFHGLEKEDVWLDEAFSIYHSQHSFSHIINLDDNHPPLYTLILSVFVKMFGISEFSARLPSAILGILSVVLIYLYGKYAFNKQVGVIASIILALSSYHIYYSQEARMYSLLGFLSLASLYYYLRFRDTPNMVNSILYLTSSILLIYTHYFGVLVVVSQNIHYFLLSSNKKVKKWTFLQIIMLLSYVPWIFKFIYRVQKIDSGFWITKSYLLLVFLYPFIYAGGITLGILYFSLFLYSIRYYLRNIKKINNNERSQMKLLLVFIFVPIILAVIYSIVIAPILSHQYVIYSSLGLFIVIAYGISKLRKSYKSILIFTIILVSMIYIIIGSSNQIKYKWKDSASYVKSMAKSNDAIVVFPGHHEFPFLFYFDDCFQSMNMSECLRKKNLLLIDNEYSQLSELPEQTRNVFFIETTPNTLNKVNVSKLLDGKYKLISTKSFKSSTQVAEFFLIDYLIHKFDIHTAENLIEKYTIKISISQYKKSNN